MLTDMAIKRLKPKDKLYKVADRDGMYVSVATTGQITFRYDYLSTAETNCAKWRRESVPVGLREKGRKALEFGIAARIEPRGA